MLTNKESTYEITSAQTDMDLTILHPNGMSRAKQLLPILPFSKSTLWEWSKDGRFPAPVKVSNTITAWRNCDVLDWLEHWHHDKSEINNSDNNKMDGC